MKKVTVFILNEALNVEQIEVKFYIFDFLIHTQKCIQKVFRL